MNSVPALTEAIDIDINPSNLLIKGTCRTGKTYLAIQLIRKLLQANIPVTVINSTFSVGRISDDYAEMFSDMNGDYWHQIDKEGIITSSQLFGIGLLHGRNAYALPIEKVISCLPD
jgi:ATP-dependent protease Clp ATPase subunit